MPIAPYRVMFRVWKQGQINHLRAARKLNTTYSSCTYSIEIGTNQQFLVTTNNFRNIHIHKCLHMMHQYAQTTIV